MAQKNYQYPVAEIKNAAYDEMLAAYPSSSHLAHTTGGYTPTDELVYILGENLRKTLPDSDVTTFTYTPLIGVTSHTDHRGITTYYKYDHYGQLKEIYTIKDSRKIMLQLSDYNYSE